jgi:hypothetical protein
MKNPVDGFSVGLADDNNILEWQCMMEGPPESDYEGDTHNHTHYHHTITSCRVVSCRAVLTVVVCVVWCVDRRLLPLFSVVPR